jgi:D-amino-acid dehydrogenase
VPGWLADPLGPLTIRWPYLPQVAPWLVRFLRHGTPEEVARIAAAMRSLMAPVFEDYERILPPARFRELIRRNGCLYVYETEAELAAARWSLDLRRDLGARMEEIGAAEIAELEPALARRFSRGIFAPDNGSTVDPSRLVNAIADEVRAAGGRILGGEVRDFDFDATGPAAAVTDAGPVPFDALVLAAGAWSGRLAARLGVRVPLETQRGYHVTFAEPGIEVNRTVMWNRRSVFVNPMTPGLRIAGTVELAGLAAAPNWDRAGKLAQIAAEMFPGLDRARPSQWMGHRPCLPDSLPVIDRAPRHRNVILAFGHQHVGMCSAAPTGRLVADLVAGRRPAIALAPFSVSRFGRATAAAAAQQGTEPA